MTQTTPKILGQKKPDPSVETNLFTVTLTHQCQLSIFACNQSSSFDQINIALVPFGQTETAVSYIAYQTTLFGNGVFSFSGLFLNSGDSVVVFSTNGTTSFTATGMDVSPS